MNFIGHFLNHLRGLTSAMYVGKYIYTRVCVCVGSYIVLYIPQPGPLRLFPLCRCLRVCGSVRFCVPAIVRGLLFLCAATIVASAGTAVTIVICHLMLTLYLYCTSLAHSVLYLYYTDAINYNTQSYK